MGCRTDVEEETVKRILLRCEQCNGSLTVDKDKKVIVCPYCGSQTLIMENDAVVIERIKANTKKAIEIEKIKSRDRLNEMQAEQEKIREQKAEIEKFRKGKLAKFLIFSAIIASTFAFIYFSTKHILSGVLAVVQAGCFLSAWCMGMNIIKEKKRFIHVLIALLGFILVIPTIQACGLNNGNSDNFTKISWENLDLGHMIPQTKTKQVWIVFNDNQRLYINVKGLKENDYLDYIKKCKNEYGFDVNAKKLTSTIFEAYNEKGYKLRISFLKGHYMSISLDSPISSD